MRETKLTIMLGLTFIVLIGVICWAVSPKEVDAYEQLPTFRQIQQQLVDLGEDIEVDGRIGKKSIAAWDRQICNQHGINDYRKWVKK